MDPSRDVRWSSPWEAPPDSQPQRAEAFWRQGATLRSATTGFLHILVAASAASAALACWIAVDLTRPVPMVLWTGQRLAWIEPQPWFQDRRRLTRFVERVAAGLNNYADGSHALDALAPCLAAQVYEGALSRLRQREGAHAGRPVGLWTPSALRRFRNPDAPGVFVVARGSWTEFRTDATATRALPSRDPFRVEVLRLERCHPSPANPWGLLVTERFALQGKRAQVIWDLSESLDSLFEDPAKRSLERIELSAIPPAGFKPFVLWSP